VPEPEFRVNQAAGPARYALPELAMTFRASEWCPLEQTFYLSTIY
jgi:hypothetical protein